MYSIKRWWYGKVVGKCYICKRQVCEDYPNPYEKPYLEDWRLKMGMLHK